MAVVIPAEATTERMRECAEFIIAQLDVIAEESASLQMFGEGSSPKERDAAREYNTRIGGAKARIKTAMEQLQDAFADFV